MTTDNKNLDVYPSPDNSFDFALFNDALKQARAHSHDAETDVVIAAINSLNVDIQFIDTIKSVFQLERTILQYLKVDPNKRPLGLSYVEEVLRLQHLDIFTYHEEVLARDLSERLFVAVTAGILSDVGNTQKTYQVDMPKKTLDEFLNLKTLFIKMISKRFVQRIGLPVTDRIVDDFATLCSRTDMNVQLQNFDAIYLGLVGPFKAIVTTEATIHSHGVPLIDLDPGSVRASVVSVPAVTDSTIYMLMAQRESEKVSHGDFWITHSIMQGDNLHRITLIVGETYFGLVNKSTKIPVTITFTTGYFDRNHDRKFNTYSLDIANDQISSITLEGISNEQMSKLYRQTSLQKLNRSGGYGRLEILGEGSDRRDYEQFVANIFGELSVIFGIGYHELLNSLTQDRISSTLENFFYNKIKSADRELTGRNIVTFLSPTWLNKEKGLLNL